MDQQGKWSAQAANEYMTTALTAYNESNKNMIEAVICNNDGMAEGGDLRSQRSRIQHGKRKDDTRFSELTRPMRHVNISPTRNDRNDKAGCHGMAAALSHLASNGIEGKSTMSNTENYHVDSGVAKIRISYSKYLGE